MANAVNVLDGLPQLPVSEVKKRGWKGIMRLVGETGPVVVTNHAQPEAVIVPTAEYARLRESAKHLDARLDAVEVVLRKEWDERLAVLNEPGARERMDALLSGPIRLHGKVKAGEGW